MAKSKPMVVKTKGPESSLEPVPFASGGERSQLAPRFDLIPREFLECLADRLALGLRQHGEREILSVYRRSDETGRRIILMDEHWWTEMLNHLQDHVISLRDEDYQEDDLWGHAGAVMWNAGMIAWLDRKRRELRKEVFDAARQK